MNELQIFNNGEFEMRTLEEKGKILFCGVDVANAIGYVNPRDALKKHCRYVAKRDIPHPQNKNKTIEMLFIPEGDVYRLIIKSNLPAADKFESWVCDEVLPSIRRNGYYLPETKTAEYWNTLPEDSTEFQIMLEQERGRIARRECRRKARAIAEAEHEAELHRLDRERISEYLKNKKRVCVAEIWYDCMGKTVPPKKYDSNKIASIIIEIGGWQRSNSVSRFKKHGRQRAFIKGGAVL